MHGELLRFGPLAISTYGVIVAVAILVGGHVTARGFEARKLPADDAWGLIGWGVVGGFVGAKLYYAVLQGDPGALLGRGGLVWYGGLLGGLAAAAWDAHRRSLPFRDVGDALAPALALGHGIGHVGCYFSGDSYGLPSDLPWAVAFPRGAPPSTAGNLRALFGVDLPPAIPDEAVLSVHPTMLYSAVALGIVFLILRWTARRRPPAGGVFGLYLVLAGTERFLVEFVRVKDDRFLLGFTTAQAIAALAIVAGATVLVTLRRRGRSRSVEAGPVRSAGG